MTPRKIRLWYSEFGIHSLRLEDFKRTQDHDVYVTSPESFMGLLGNEFHVVGHLPEELAREAAIRECEIIYHD